MRIRTLSISCRTLAFCIMALILAPSCSGENPLEFTLLLRNADGLQRGQHVIYQGVRVGTVRSVDLGEEGQLAVRVRIDSRYSDQIYREARFSIENREGTVSTGMEKQITIRDRIHGSRTPIVHDDVIRADRLSEILSGARDWIGTDRRSAADWIGERSKRMWQAAQDYASSPEGQKLRADMERFLADARRVGEEQHQQFMEQRYPEIREKAWQLKERMEEEGLAQEAKELWDAFIRIWEGEDGPDTDQPEPGDQSP